MPEILKDLTVIDLSQNIAGPFCSQLLADYGAQVIKVERPGVGDDTRRWTLHTWHGLSTSYLTFNRNKKSICVDIKSENGAQVIRDLCENAHIFLHSVRPGRLERYGLGYEDLRAINPGLVYCAISAYGNKGPMKNDAGYDALLQAFTGIMSINGHADRPPARVGVSLLDMSSGIWAFATILAALHRRRDTGKGAFIAGSLMETGVSWMSLFLSHFMATGDKGERTGDMTPLSAPYETFRTLDGTVLIVASNDNLYGNVCRALGLDSLISDPRFVTNSLRILPENRKALHEQIEAKTSVMTSEQCVSMMRKEKAPCSMINSVDSVFKDEQVSAMGMIRDLPAKHLPDFKTVDLPFSIDGDKASLRSAPPRLGEHTQEVLSDIGYRKERIDALMKSNAVS